MIAQGSLVVDTSVKKVQHPTGGVVAELKVRDGHQVKAGDIVIKLDDTQTRANLAIVSKGLDELAARRAREEAELEGEATITFPAELLARSKDDPEVARLISGETKLFETRRKTREGLKSQLSERILQSEEEIRGLTAQVASKEKQIEWIQQELEGVRDLWSKKLVQFNRVTSLEREQARLDGERGQLIAAIAQSKGKIAETRIQILQIDQDMRTEVGKDLAEIRGKTAELVEKRVAAEDQLKRVDIRAPQDGMVHQLDVHTVGGVVSAGQQIMLIVPGADKLIVEAKVQPQDIDQVRIGQAAVMRFSNFNFAHHARDQRRGKPGVRRRHAGSAHRVELLHGAHLGAAGRTRASSKGRSSSPACRSRFSSRRRCARSSPTSCVRSRIRSPRRSAKNRINERP